MCIISLYIVFFKWNACVRARVFVSTLVYVLQLSAFFFPCIIIIIRCLCSYLGYLFSIYVRL